MRPIMVEMTEGEALSAIESIRSIPDWWRQDVLMRMVVEMRLAIRAGGPVKPKEGASWTSAS